MGLLRPWSREPPPAPAKLIGVHQTSTDVSTTIRDLEDRRYQAAVDKDWDTFASVCHPALAYAHSNGVTDTLQKNLDKVRAEFYVYHDVDRPIDEIRIVDDVAIVLGETNARVTAGGAEKTLRNKCLAVWKNTDEGWRLLAYQLPVPAPST